MRVLAIGNSFSQDATRYVRKIAEGAGTDLYVRNTYIGGCSLERHLQELYSGERSYEFQEDGAPLRFASLSEALSCRDWDWVTFQQVSGLSGEKESFEPWLSLLVKEVRGRLPRARIALHETWAYESTSDHPDFARYDRDTDRMAEAIASAYRHYAGKYGFPVIRSGRTVARMRAEGTTGDMPVTRDGYHLSLDYGRYAAALTWFAFFAGKDVRSSYAPEDADPEIIGKINQIVYGEE